VAVIEPYSLVSIVQPDIAQLTEMVRLLRRVGHQTIGARTFAEARAQMFLDPPRILITEARLGAFSGLHLIYLARHLRPECQPILIGNAPDPPLEREALEAGVVFLARPLSATALPAVIATLLGVGTPREVAADAGLQRDRRQRERRQLVIPGFTPERRVAERRRIQPLRIP
jgi:DNA-binding NtrC family response regulator